MSVLTINLPESLAEKLRKTSEKEQVEPEQFVVIAVAEKLANLKSIGYLERRAERAKLEDFEMILNKIPNIEPEDYDKI